MTIQPISDKDYRRLECNALGIKDESELVGGINGYEKIPLESLETALNNLRAGRGDFDLINIFNVHGRITHDLFGSNFYNEFTNLTFRYQKRLFRSSVAYTRSTDSNHFPNGEAHLRMGKFRVRIDEAEPRPLYDLDETEEMYGVVIAAVTLLPPQWFRVELPNVPQEKKHHEYRFKGYKLINGSITQR